MKFYFFSLLIIFVVLACHKDEDRPDPALSELTTYINAFSAEAAKHQVTPIKTVITAQIVDAAVVAPDNSSYSTETGEVLISNVWYNYTLAQREILLYDILARVMLGRTTTDEKLPNCVDYKSMLNDNNSFVAYDATDSTRRTYYVDELFDPSTAYPSWGGMIGANKTNVAYSQDSWAFFQVDGTANTGNVETDGSLHIHGQNNGQGRGYWMLKIPSTGVTGGSTIVVSFKMKTTAITGNGPIVTIQAKADPTFTGSTYKKITGTTDWTDMQLTVNCYPASSDLLVFLSLDGFSNGDVWFDDVVIDYYN